MAVTNYTETAVQTQEAWARAAESWTNSFQKLLGQTPDITVGQMDPTGAVDQYFDFGGRLLEVNRQYMKNLAGTSLNVVRAVQDHSASITGLVRQQVGATVEAARHQVQTLEQAERAQAAQARRVERDLVKQQGKAVHDQVANKYSELTKAELSDKLAARDLPRTGNVDELRERLIEADLQSA